MFDNLSEETNPSLIRFEQMLKTNQVLFFDALEFENIIHHYIDFAQFNLAKKAIKMGMEQHPENVELMLLKSELFILRPLFGMYLIYQRNRGLQSSCYIIVIFKKKRPLSGPFGFRSCNRKRLSILFLRRLDSNNCRRIGTISHSVLTRIS